MRGDPSRSTVLPVGWETSLARRTAARQLPCFNNGAFDDFTAKDGAAALGVFCNPAASLEAKVHGQ